MKENFFKVQILQKLSLNSQKKRPVKYTGRKCKINGKSIKLTEKSMRDWKIGMSLKRFS